VRIAIHTLGLPVTGEDPARLALGGSETAVVSIARALARRGHEVEVFANVARPARVAEVGYRPAPEVSEAAGGPPDVFLAARHLGVLDRPDLPHAARARLVGLWHHDMPVGGLLTSHPRALSRAHFSFFLSRFQRDAFERVVPGLSASAWMTTNGVDFDALEAVRAEAPTAASTSTPISAGAPRFLYASRPERGLAPLLRRIWPRLRERLPGAELLVSTYHLAGLEPPAAIRRHTEAVHRLAERTPGVHLLGARSRDDLWRRLVGATAILYPAEYPEVSCMVALEAQAAGVPVLTSDAYALSETVASAETRVAGAPGSRPYVDRFVEVAVRLAEDESLRERIAAEGRAHVSRASHSWDALAEAWEAGFEERLARPARRAPRPRLSATLLVRDEAESVGRSIESFAGVADEVVVGDTGGSPEVRAVLDRLGFVRVGGEGAEGAPSGQAPPARRVVPIDFVDFAQARNELARHATGDWIFWQDADEELHGAEALRRWVDENVFFDAFALEQKNATFEGRVSSNHPIRCFRRETADGPLAWFGCIHELVEHGCDRPPRRLLRLPDAWVAHYGYLTLAQRNGKARGRNFELLLRDRERNPERLVGFVLGLRECLNVARHDLADAGELTERGHRHLQLGFEIWRRRVENLPPAFRNLGFPYSREILAILAAHGLPLESTGKVPIEVDFSFSAARGALSVDGRDIPRNRQFYADGEELRRDFDTRLAGLEEELENPLPRPPEDLAPGAPETAGLELPPELFGLPGVTAQR
jgi:glycosyltransferase involved in cell wall biosynthesis